MKRLFVYLIAAFFCVVSSETQVVAFKKLGMQEGLSHTTVYSIYQDELGALWFGTRQGLNYYDGTKIQKISIAPKPENVTNHIVWKIDGDKNGSVYFLVNTSLMEYDIENQEVRAIGKSEVDDFIFHEENLWILSEDQLEVLNPESGTDQTVKKFETGDIGYRSDLLGTADAVWVALKKGLIRISKEENEEQLLLGSNEVSALHKDKDGNVWAGTSREGLFKISQAGKLMKRYPITSDEIRCLEQDNQGNIFGGTFDGLLKFDPSTGEVNIHSNIENMPYSLSHSSVYSLYKDHQGTIWVGTYYGGVNYYNPQKDIFEIYRPNSLYDNQLSFPIVGNMTEDKEGNLWVCTEGGGLNKIDRQKGAIQTFRAEKGKNSIPRDNLKSIWYDSVANKLYIGTHKGGLSVLDIELLKFSNYNSEASDAKSLPNDVVNKVVPYKGRLFLITQAGIPVLDVSSGKLSRNFWDQHPELPETSVANIFVDSSERIWMSFFGWGVVMYDTQSGELTDYRNRPSGPSSLPHSRVVDFFEDSNNRVFFTTEGAGVLQYDEKNDEFNRFTAQKDGLLSDFCLNLAESPGGQLAITSYEGITFFDVENGESQYYTIHDNLPLSGIIEENGLFVASDGEIFVGGINGMISFYENDIDSFTVDYRLRFSKLYINNQLVLPGDKTGVLDKTLPYTTSIELNHQQTNVTFEFATSNYVQHLKKDFEYKLEGFNENWVTADGFTISYTNISPGDYTLVVREKQKNNEEAKQTRLHIVVTPPFYATTLAFLLYALLIISLITGIILFNRSKAMLRASLRVERKEKQQIKVLNQSKLRFFTNISHEFRTPLTLIINHTDIIQQIKDVSPNIHNHILKIKKHTSRMRHLINELLDFRKQEQGELKIHVENINLTEFLDDIYSSFKDYARIKKIDFHFDHSGEEIRVWCDPYQMQKVFFNLLSNAFRFTSPGEKVALRISPKSQSIVIKVRDTGKGIEKGALNRVFDRFYQVENIASYEELNMTSGIGLALSKAIVELHGGTIAVDSIPGEGSTFRVELPTGESHFTREQKQEFFAKDVIDDGQLEIADEQVLDAPLDSDENKEGMPSILIVEDNEDLLEILKELFEPVYNVRTAENGEEGLEKALESIPDIVLSDVMMAKISGTELCQRLKTNNKTSHVPVVLLTALSDPDQTNQAFLTGADDYIQKPFDSANLVVRCNNLVSTRRRLKEKFSGMEIPENALLARDTKDKEFIDRLDELIEENLSNPEFKVDALAKEIGVGRSKLYSRIKEVTGLTPNGYILDYKMKKGSYYLRTDKRLSVSEIAYKLGFSSSRYFSLCFKEHYGVAPSKMKNKGEEPEEGES